MAAANALLTAARMPRPKTSTATEHAKQPVLQELRNAYLKYDKYRDACVAAQGWLSNSLRGSMAIDALLQQPGSAPLKEVLGPALEGQLADVATGQAMLQLLIQLQTEADMERASDDETAAVPPAAATEHRPLTGLPFSAPKPHASASEYDFLLEDDDLEKIVAMLLWMSQDFQPKLCMKDIHHAVLEAVIKCADAPTGGTLGLLHTTSVEKLSQVIDIMMLHKNGSPKDANQTLAFMRSCASIRNTMLQSAWRYNATERVELDTNDVSSCYQRYGRNLITHDLLPHQKQDSRYRLRNDFDGDTHLSGVQRSFVDQMLRKGLGDRRVAFRIWQHGLPRLADLPAIKVLDMGMLQSSLDECILWYTSLANDIATHQSQEGFDIQVSASSLDGQERQRQQTRREALQKAWDALRLGATLAKQRDHGKRAYEDMDEAEQKTLEDYETDRIKKAKQEFTAQPEAD